MDEMKKIELTINGEQVVAEPGQTIYEVVSGQGIDEIPTLCHSPALAPYASCFVCVVEMEGKPNLVPACSTKVAPGMVLNTRNERVVKSRQTALELLMSNHYADCVAPCEIGCPAHVDVQGYIALAARGQFAEAADLVRETNPLPAVCGRVCVRKCEAVCRREMIDSPVAINDLKRYITDSPGSYESTPECDPPTGKKIAIVGAGPAGLTAGYFLGRQGHSVVIYEMMAKTGGMLRYGIPDYRLPQDILDLEVDYIQKTGVEIRCNQKFGRDIELEDLRKDNDAVFLAMGAIASNQMRVPGEDTTEGVLKGLEFLIERTDNPEPISGVVIVVGGGNTAMDAARTAIRLGADKVICLYRRTRNEMPADPIEIEEGIEEGMDLMELAAPEELVTDESGRLTAIKCIRMKLGEPDSSGRRRPVPLEGSEFIQNCDWCISAIGQSPILDGITEGDDMPETTRWNTLVAEAGSYATRVPGVFAGGDVETGPSVAIDCIAAGKSAAMAIGRFLNGESAKLVATPSHKGCGAMVDTPSHAMPIISRKDNLAEVTKGEFAHLDRLQRQELDLEEPEERSRNFDEISHGLGFEEMMHEWKRCLSCGCMASDNCKLRDYCTDYGVDMVNYSGQVRKHKVDDRHPNITIDNNKCILCAQCIRTCDKVLGISALGLVNRGFNTVVLPEMGKALVDTACVACGNCVAVCPTGALSAKWPFPGRAVVKTVDEPSTCGFCSIGCETRVRESGTGRYWVEHPDKPGSNLCHYGRFGSELFIDQKRVVAPVVNSGLDTRELSFDEAYSHAADKLKQAVDTHGAEAVAVFASPELTNEQMFLAQRIAREGLGTNNIACLSTLLSEDTPNTLTPSFGFTASTSDRNILEKADLIVINNCDLENDQLILSMKVIEAVERGAKLVVASSIASRLHEMAALQVNLLRGSASLYWQWVAKLMFESKAISPASMEEMTDGKAFMESLGKFDTSNIEDRTGAKQHHADETAKLLLNAKHVVFLTSPDRTVDQSPSDYVVVGNLMSMLCAKGAKTDLLLPRLAANSAGLESCGIAVEFAPGRQPVSDDLTKVTKDRNELLDRLKAGKIRAALIVGEDPLNDDKLSHCFHDLDFLVVVEPTMTETAIAANLVLPGTYFLEEDGSRVNFGGCLKDFKGVIASPSGKQSWEILAGIANALDVNAVGKTLAENRDQLEKIVVASYGKQQAFYWNTGQKRDWQGPKAFIRVTPSAKPHPAAGSLTTIQRYKHDKNVVGVDQFRVRK